MNVSVFVEPQDESSWASPVSANWSGTLFVIGTKFVSKQLVFEQVFLP
jgi:hypothetical protein